MIELNHQPNIGNEMFDWISTLFPKSRSIVGPGIDDAIEFIRNKIPSNVESKILKFRSGSKIGDWTVPQAWELRRAYICDPNGKVLIDTDISNLHIWSHSMPFSGKVKHEELMTHILVGTADEIPYGTTYYKDNWGFSITRIQLESMIYEEYFVSVETNFISGNLSLLECVIPGRYAEEIFFSSYICHPSMANNELSGPSLMLALIRTLSKQELNYTFRFVLGPETIGAICYLSQNHTTLKEKVWAALNLTCVGGKGEWSYLQSRTGTARIDNSIRKTLKCLNLDYKEYPFLARGSDERQYSSPNVGLPMASVMRSKYHEYNEYHTSKDDLTFVSATFLQESFEFYNKLIYLLDNEGIFTANQVGEPFLSKWYRYGDSGGIHPSQLDSKTKLASNIIAYSDKQSLVEISDDVKECPFSLIDLINELVSNGLVKKSPTRPKV